MFGERVQRARGVTRNTVCRSGWLEYIVGFFSGFRVEGCQGIVDPQHSDESPREENTDFVSCMMLLPYSSVLDHVLGHHGKELFLDSGLDGNKLLVSLKETFYPNLEICMLKILYLYRAHLGFIDQLRLFLNPDLVLPQKDHTSQIAKTATIPSFLDKARAQML